MATVVVQARDGVAGHCGDKKTRQSWEGCVFQSETTVFTAKL